jgi:exopolyphosphatase/guanosine-5'-triphosphate,3'-diphosphate pyrophosphatase
MSVPVGVLDIGSNTIRLLVARVESASIVPIDGGRVRLPLGVEIEREGRLSDTSIAAAAKAVRKFCDVARKRGVASLDVFLTAPGRQSANADELVEALERAAKHPVRVLTTEEEGQLAYAGAIATADVTVEGTVAVCDVGGASTEIAVGSSFRVPDWIESVDLGSVRLAARANDLADAQQEAAAAFADVAPPRVDVALAVGGSARAVGRLVGPWLGESELAEALRILDATAPRDVSRRYGVDRSRAGSLPGGAAILAQVQTLLGTPLHVCSGGIREGAVLATAAAAAA